MKNTFVSVNGLVIKLFNKKFEHEKIYACNLFNFSISVCCFTDSYRN